MLIAVAAYVVGMFPSAILVARAASVDITSVGSGNPGAANITRNLGWKRGIWVFVLDAAKGAVAVGAGLAIDDRPLAYLAGAAAILGHCYPA
ncbi:MAG: glycerol-3-phosphate acyltransferase, partial [Actinomycetota bacterium]|nr:glycerol-3-phosphate acyltransferase [Actinomycetota bacterium]